MSLDDAYDIPSQESIDKFGKQLIQRYGEMPCQEAEVLDQTSLSSGSLSTYKPQLRQIIKFAGEPNPPIEVVLDFIEDSEKSGSTNNVALMAAKKYYNAIGEFTKAEDLSKAIEQDVNNNFDFSQGMSVKGWLTVDEIDLIFEHICPPQGESSHEVSAGGAEYFINIEHKAVFAALYYTGMRVGEIVMLRVEDIYPRNNEVEAYRLKKQGNEIPREMIAVPQQLIDILQEYMEFEDITSGRVFRFTSRTAERRIDVINTAYKTYFGEFDHADKLTPHTLRHSRVTAIANHSSIEEAGKYVGHSSPEITSAYRHLATEEQRKILPENAEVDITDDALEELAEQMGVDSKEELISRLEALDKLK